MVAESDRDDFRETIPVQIRHHGHLRDSAVDGNAQAVRPAVPEPLFRRTDAATQGTQDTGLIAEAAIRVEGDLAIYWRADQEGLQTVAVGIAVIGQHTICTDIQNTSIVDLVLVIHCLGRAVDVQHGDDKAAHIQGAFRVPDNHAHVMGTNLAFLGRPADGAAGAVDTQPGRRGGKAEGQRSIFGIAGAGGEAQQLPPYQGLIAGQGQCRRQVGGAGARGLDDFHGE